MGSEREPASPGATDQVQAGAATPADDELLGVIADVERQLASLRTYRAQHEEARVRWHAVEDELSKRAAELNARGVEIASEQEKLALVHARMKEIDADLARRAEAVEKDFQSLAEEQRRAAESAEKREADLTGRATTLEQREQRLAEQGASVSKQREQVQALEAQVAARERALGERAAEIDLRSKEVAALGERASDAERSAREGAERLARLEAEIGAARAEVARAHDGERGAASRAQELSTELESLRRDLQRAGEAQGELIRTMTEREAVLKETKEKARAVASEAERRAEALAESERRVADFKRQVIERDGRIQDLSAKLAAATGKFREVSQGLQEQAELVGRAREFEAALEERTARVEALEAEVATLREAGAAESIPDPAVLAERETLRLRAEKLEEQLLESRRRLEAAGAELAKRESQAGEGGEAGEGQFHVPEEVGEAIITRWRRLRLMRSILREQADKLRQAGEAVRARYGEVEDVTRQREALARERAAFAAARSGLQPKAEKGGHGSPLAAIAYVSVAIAALAGLSWAIGGQLAPATFAARATVSADAQGTAPSPEQLAEWEKYHESLLKDPGLTDTAAERMGRRGIVSLSTPGALMSRLGEDMTAESPAPGKLTLELRGRGASETVRVLDTYVTALVSQANADRERRTDGLSTSISEAPSAGAGPIDDQRLIYAGVVFVLGGAMSVAGGGLLWRRVVRARERFERDHGDGATPAEWEKPPQEYAR
jgi:hypothetical protein